MSTDEYEEWYLLLLADYEYEELTKNEQYLAVPITLIIGIFGLIANIWALRIIWISTALHNCFGLLMIIHALANIVLLCCFAFWPIPLLFDNSLADSTLGFKIGQLTIVCYYITLYAQLTKAINRFFAIYSPVKYRMWFSNKNSKFIIIPSIIFGLAHSILYFFPGCNLYYDGAYVCWDYDYTPCYDIMSFYTDLVIGCFIILIIMLIDGSTLYMILKRGLLKKEDNREAKLFIQTFSASILYVVSSLSDQYLTYLNTNKWYIFVTSTLGWELCHVIDGVLMVVFNRRKTVQNTSSVVSTSTLTLTNSRSITRIT